jgi:hypothetical protein
MRAADREACSRSNVNEFSVAHAFRGRVRTASGSDRIRNSREIHLGLVRCNPFPRGFFLIRGDFLIRSLPLAVLTHWATENLLCG